jgi:hypothetical protein
MDTHGHELESSCQAAARKKRASVRILAKGKQKTGGSWESPGKTSLTRDKTGAKDDRITLNLSVSESSNGQDGKQPRFLPSNPRGC